MTAKCRQADKKTYKYSRLIRSLCFIFRIRMAGIKGLQGVVRKTVNDELQANIWDPQHMDKIVPSLLFNLQSGERTER